MTSFPSRRGPEGTRLSCLLVAVVLLSAGLAHGADSPSPSPFARLVEEVLLLFPKVQADVIEVEGDRVTIAAGRRDGVRPGLTLTLYREGRELRHPRTGEVLGRTEQVLGQVSVQRVFETYASGATHTAGAIRPGDKARFPDGRVPLTLLALASGVKENLLEAVTQELVEGLARTGRFQVTSGDRLRVWLIQAAVSAPEVLEGRKLDGLAERFKIEHLLVLHVKRVEGRPYMEVKLFTPPAGRAWFDAAMFVPSSVRPVATGEFSASTRAPSAPPPKPRSLLARLLGLELEVGAYSSGDSSISLREVARFPFPVVGMDVAVAPRDKGPRLVVTDGERVFLYRIGDQVLEPEWTYGARAIGRVISVQLADLDGDGVLEVVANRFDTRIGLSSFVLASSDGKARPVAGNIPDILLAVDPVGAGVRGALWAQKFHPDLFFTAGQVQEVTVNDGRVVFGGRVARIPSDFRATGATFSNIAGNAPRALVFVDQHQRLRIALDGQEIWQSGEPVGRGLAVVEVVEQGPRVDRAGFHRMEPTPLAVDLDGDGIEEIVVPQNQVPGMLAVVFRSPAGYRLQSVKTGFGGLIVGLGAIPRDGGPILVAAVVHRQGFLGRSGETQILMTE